MALEEGCQKEGGLHGLARVPGPHGGTIYLNKKGFGKSRDGDGASKRKNSSSFEGSTLLE